MYNGLNALTRRTLGVIAVGLALAANTASAEFLFAVSGDNGVNNLTVNDAVMTRVLKSHANQGWWSGDFPNVDSNFQYFVGTLTVPNKDAPATDYHLNNFFIFDISDVVAPVTYAELQLVFSTPLFNGAQSLTYTLFDVSTNLTDLNKHIGFDPIIYNDLGSGKSYGSRSFSISDNLSENDVVSLILNSAGLADLNKAIANGAQQFAIGGTLTPLVIAEQQSSVPDSGDTLVLFGLAVAGIWSLRKRKQAA